MKKHFKFLLCVMLILSISCSLFCMSASASNVFYLSTDDYCNGIIVYEFYSDITDSGFSQAQGSFAPGLVYDHSGSFLLISGNPTAPGTYTLSGMAYTADGEQEPYSFTIVVESSYVEPTPAPIPTPVPTPVPTETPRYGPELTKNPTSESVLEGDSAVFIARASDADRIEWYLIEPGTYSAYAPGAVASMYPQFSFSGRNNERFEMYNIPLELNNWMVQCYFSNAYGSVVSDYASIHVEKFSPQAPTINGQPQSADLKTGESVTLNVTAYNNNNRGGTLMYQWYMSSTPSGNRNPISGANSSSYTPAQTEGTVYYTVAVWTNYQGRDTEKVYSNPAAVTYSKPAPSPTVAPSPTPAVTPSPAVTVMPSPTVTPAPEKSGGNGILVVFIVAMVLAAALLGVVLLILRKNGKATEDASPITSAAKPAAEKAAAKAAVSENKSKSVKNWQCSCGALNNSPFCTQCGKSMPVVKSCANCGWTPDSPNSIPHFCPECGKAFDEE